MLRVYIGHIGEETTADLLADLLMPYGQVTGVSVKTGGFAFVEMSDGSRVDDAVAELNGITLGSSVITVEPSRDAQVPANAVAKTNVRVHFANLSPSMEWQALEEMAKEFGALQRAEIIGSNAETGARRGVVQFDTDADAQRCIQGMNGRLNAEGGEITAYRVETRRPRQQSSGGGAAARGGASRSNSGGLAAAAVSIRAFLPGRYGAGAERVPLQLLLPSGMVGAIIGKGGATVKDITRAGGARIDVKPRDGPSNPDRLVSIEGNLDNMTETYRLVAVKIEEEAASIAAQNGTEENGADNESGDARVPLKMLVPNELVGHLIGKGGAHVKTMMEQTGASISISSQDQMMAVVGTGGQPLFMRCVTCTGTLDAQCAAQVAICAKLQAVVTSMLEAAGGVAGLGGAAIGNGGAGAGRGGVAYPGGMVPGAMMGPGSMMQQGPYGMVSPAGFATVERTTVYVPESIVGSIMGRGGANIKELHRVSEATIQVQKSSAGEGGDGALGERRVVITGTPDAQFKAQQVIYMKLQDASGGGYPNATDVFMKVEVPIRTDVIGRIIGKGGAKIREITQVSRAHLDIVRADDDAEGEAEETNICITGTFVEAQAAQGIIRQIIGDARMRTVSGGGQQ